MAPRVGGRQWWAQQHLLSDRNTSTRSGSPNVVFDALCTLHLSNWLVESWLLAAGSRDRPPNVPILLRISCNLLFDRTGTVSWSALETSVPADGLRTFSFTSKATPSDSCPLWAAMRPRSGVLRGMGCAGCALHPSRMKLLNRGLSLATCSSSVA